MERIKFESEYIKQNIEAYKLLRSYNYSKAVTKYKQCSAIANNLKDDYKVADSSCNQAIALFYEGKLKESYKILDRLYQQLEAKAKAAKSSSSYSAVKSAKISTKIACNLIIVNLALNNIEEANDCLSSLLNLIKVYDDDCEMQSQLMKIILYVFFRVDSLVNLKTDPKLLKNTKIEIEEGDEEGSDKHKEIILKIINAFHYSMQTQDIQIWINCLYNQIENLKKLGDYNGLLFALFNYNSFLLYAIKKGEAESRISFQNCQDKIISIVMAITGDESISEQQEQVNSIIDAINKKIEFIMMLYKMFSGTEKEILQRQKSMANAETTKGNGYLVKLLLNYSEDYVKKNIEDEILKKQVLQQIALTKKINEENKGNVKMKFVSSEISKAFECLMNNLLSTYRNAVYKKVYRRFYNNYYQFKQTQTKSKIEKFLQLNYAGIGEGSTVIKINYSSSGTQNLFYQLDFKNDALKVFKLSRKKDYYKSHNLSKISKIYFGIKTENAKKRMKKLKAENQWDFLSLKEEDKTVDLILADADVKKWFYGLYYYLRESQRLSKICSPTSYLIGSIKLKLIHKLTSLNKQEVKPIKLSFQIRELVDENGIYNHKASFVKVLLMFKKCGQL